MDEQSRPQLPASHVRVELASPRAWWAFWSGLTSLMSVVATLLAVFLVVGLTEVHPLMVVGAVASAVWAVVAGLAAKASYSLARTRPALHVDDDGVVLANPAVFEEPVRVDRALIRGVYLLTGNRSRRDGSVWQRLRGSAHDWEWRHSRTTRTMSSWYAPDLSATLPGEVQDLLIVLRSPLALGPQVRRGLGSLGATAPLIYKAPTRGTVARGFFARVEDPTVLSRAFASWSTSSEPEPEVWGWLRAGRRR